MKIIKRDVQTEPVDMGGAQNCENLILKKNLSMGGA